MEGGRELLGRNKCPGKDGGGVKESENDYNLLNTSVKQSKANKDFR